MKPFAMVTGDFVTTGGMDRANHALASYLLRQGRQTHLVAFRADAALTGMPGARFHRVAKPLNSYALGLRLLRRQGGRVAERVAAAGGRVVVNGGNCRWGDINWVHYVHSEWRPPVSGGLARRLKSALFQRVEARAEREALLAARVVVANSERTRTAVIERIGVDPAKVKTVYYGVDAERFKPATSEERSEARARLGWNDARPTFAFVGALGDARKGFDTLFEAWCRLCKDPAWDGRLAVVGTGATLDHWRGEAEGRGLTGSVVFLGFRSDVPEVLRACDALVSPTRYEAYGLNVHEALCTGLPAFVTATAGVAERYPEALEGLLLPDPEDAADLSARLARWRAGASALAREAAAFGARLRGESWDGMAARFLEVVGEGP